MKYRARIWPPCQMRRVVVVEEVEDISQASWDCVHIKCFMAHVRKFGLGLGKLLLLCQYKRERENTIDINNIAEVVPLILQSKNEMVVCMMRRRDVFYCSIVENQFPG